MPRFALPDEDAAEESSDAESAEEEEEAAHGGEDAAQEDEDAAENTAGPSSAAARPKISLKLGQGKLTCHVRHSWPDANVLCITASRLICISQPAFDRQCCFCFQRLLSVLQMLHVLLQHCQLWRHMPTAIRTAQATNVRRCAARLGTMLALWEPCISTVLIGHATCASCLATPQPPAPTGVLQDNEVR